MGVPKYNHITTTEIGALLYRRWVRLHTKPCSPEFADFEKYYAWAIATGFTADSIMMRKDNDAPFSAENCHWVSEKACRNAASKAGVSWAAKWNKTVNVIREYYGMKPIEEVTEEEEDVQAEQLPSAEASGEEAVP